MRTSYPEIRYNRVRTKLCLEYALVWALRFVNEKRYSLSEGTYYPRYVLIEFYCINF